MNIGNCRVLTNKERENITKDLFLKAKKNKIESGTITNKFGEWGDVSKLLKMTKKQVELYY
jgi:hypothetical protein